MTFAIVVGALVGAIPLVFMVVVLVQVALTARSGDRDEPPVEGFGTRPGSPRRIFSRLTVNDQQRGVGVVWSVPAEVIRVIDGDTIELMLDLGWRVYMKASCRLYGINCPEKDTPEGVAAYGYTAGVLTPGTKVRFMSRKLDKYGRPLGTLIYDTNKDFNAQLIGAGHAVRMEG